MFPITHPARILTALCAACVVSLLAVTVHSEEAAVTEATTVVDGADKKVEPQIIKLADGKVLLPVPGNWKVVKPKSRIVQHEFAILPVESDKASGRVTIMSAGGGVEANIDRWVGQFKSPEGGALADEAKKVTKKPLGDITVHVVDLTGDYQESLRGPFGPKVNQPGYRMLALIIPLKQGGTWFVKSYGPAATMKAAEKDFAEMAEGIKLTQ